MPLARSTLASAVLAVAAGHACVHDTVMENLAKSVPHAVRQNVSRSLQDYGPVTDSSGRVLQGLSYQSIRIYVDTSFLDANADPFACSFAGQQIPLTLAQTSTDKYTCSAADVLDDTKRAYIRNTIIPAALDFLQATLSVIPVQGNLQLPNIWDDVPYCDGTGYGYFYRFLCCRSYFPSAWANNGVPNADYLLMLSGRPTTGSLLAWALECQSDQIGRPIAGHANLSPARVSTAPGELQYQLSVLVHEISHALGFSWSKIPQFRVPGTTNQVSSMDQVVSQYFDSTLNKFVYRVTTPKVVAAAKAQYNCYNWPNAGMELEDGGGSGTARSHWEKRVAMYEIMNGVSERVMYRSALTMAYFDDSGWYLVNYQRAESLPWGNGEGCTFVTQKCSAWDSRYFCQTAQDQGCTSDMRFGAACTYQEDQISRPSQFQYFSTPFKGGVQSISDYCPYYQGYTNKDCQDPATTYYFFFYGEAVGPSSRCFKGDFQLRSLTSARSMHSACLRTECDRTTNLIKITLASNPSTVVLCPRAGGTIDLGAQQGSQFVGTLYCPRADVLCSGGACAMNDCGGKGTCNPADGTCVCQAGFYGSNNYTCDLRRCPVGSNGMECSGNGRCNSATGICEDGTGIPGCFSGWKSADCSVRGCPAFTSPYCNTTTACECSGVGTCGNGTCMCAPGFVGSGCQFTDCPAFNGSRCGGDTRGMCDLTSGLCNCVEGFDSQAAPYYYSGSSCSIYNNGSRPFIPVYYVGTRDPSTNATAGAFNGTLRSKEYTYFQFDASSTDYSLQLTLRVNGTVTTTPPRLLASYATAGKPTVAAADFFSSSTAAGSSVQRIDFVPSSGTTITRFSRTGRILVAAVSSATQDFSLSLTRDGCSALRCVFGTCRDGTCLCDQGWSGSLCDQPDCPGTPDCSNRGSCDTSQSYTLAGVPIRNSAPVCNCTSFFTGSQCESIQNDGHSSTAPTLSFPAFLSSVSPGVLVGTQGSTFLLVNQNQRFAILNSSSSGVLDVGSFATVAIIDPRDLSNHMNGSVGVYMRLTYDADTGADGIMLAMENSQPSLDRVGSAPIDFDVVAWRRGAGVQEFVHRIASVDGSNVYIGRVFNGRYAEDRLNYDFYFEIANNICPPALRGCSGRGQCDLSTYSCVCNPGYRGLRCDLPVPALPVGPTAVNNLATGGWLYYTFDLQPSDFQIGLTFTASDNVYAQPIVVAAFDTRTTSSSLELVTSESALFDFSGVSQGAVNGTHRQTLMLRRRASQVQLVIGVHNSVNAKAALTGTLTIARYATTQTTVCQPGEFDCYNTVCHGNGAYTTDPLGCRCEPGWADAADCASPSFSSLSKLINAAQNVGSLCSLCSQSQTFAQGEMRIVSVPQTLQKSTALKLTLKNSAVNASANEGNATTGIPALLVADKLPRSVIDFVMIASNSLPNQTATLGPSSSGMYFATVLAVTSGRFSISASRQTQKVTLPSAPSFASQVSAWMLTTTQGKVVIGVTAAFLVLVIAGCAMQCATYQSVEARMDAAAKAARDETTAYLSSLMKVSDAVDKHGDKAFIDKPALKRMASVAQSIRKLQSSPGMSKGSSRNLSTRSLSRPSERVLQTPRSANPPRPAVAAGGAEGVSTGMPQTQRRPLAAGPGNFYMYQSARRGMHVEDMSSPAAQYGLQQASAAALAALSFAPPAVPVVTRPVNVDPMVPFDGGDGLQVYGSNPMLPGVPTSGPAGMNRAPMAYGGPQGVMPSGAGMGHTSSLMTHTPMTPVVPVPVVQIPQFSHGIHGSYSQPQQLQAQPGPGAQQQPLTAARSAHNVTVEF